MNVKKRMINNGEVFTKLEQLKIGLGQRFEVELKYNEVHVVVLN